MTSDTATDYTPTVWPIAELVELQLRNPVPSG
jgi:hypothetical protein